LAETVGQSLARRLFPVERPPPQDPALLELPPGFRGILPRPDPAPTVRFDRPWSPPMYDEPQLSLDALEELLTGKRRPVEPGTWRGYDPRIPPYQPSMPYVGPPAREGMTPFEGGPPATPAYEAPL